MSRWRSVTSGVPQGSIFIPVLFNIFINDKDSMLSKFAADTKLKGAVSSLEGRDTIQRDHNMLEERDCVNQMKFNKVRCTVLYMG